MQEYCTTCDPSYEWINFNGTTCFAVVEESPIPPVTTITLNSVSNILYSQYGTKIYASNYLKSGLGNVIFQGTSPVWKNVGMNLTDGPMNRSSIWNSSGNDPYNTWIGVTKCLGGAEDGREYYLGIGSNNFFKVIINGEEILNNHTPTTSYESYVYWHIYPITLYKGINVIEVYGLNTSDNGGFGCEIYDNTLSDLTSATDYSELNVVFTTNESTEVDVVQDLNGNYLTSGNTCPSGYYYASCLGTCIEKIYCSEEEQCGCLNVRIDSRDIESATGNTLYPDNTVFVGGIYSCDFTPISDEITTPGYNCYCVNTNPPPSICFNYSIDNRVTTEFTYLTLTGVYNDKSYYTIDTVGFVWWDIINGYWIFSTELGGGTTISILYNGNNDYPISSNVEMWDGESGVTSMLSSQEGNCPDSMCISLLPRGEEEYSCNVDPFSYHNGKGYYRLYDKDCITPIDLFIYWSITNSRWEFGDSLDSLYPYSYLLNNGSSPSTGTESWIVDDASVKVLSSTVGECSEISCGMEGYAYSITQTMSLPEIFMFESSPKSTFTIDLYYYVNDIQTPANFSSAILTSDSCSDSSGCCEDICNIYSYCISNTNNEYFNDHYIESGLYNGRPHWSGETNGYVIYYSTSPSQWCLSTTTGGPCLLSGKSPCSSVCPDLCDEIMYEGYCTTTTTIYTPNCSTLDFSAIFDCEVDPPPTTTTTTVPPTTTTTTTVPPCVISVDAEISTYTITPTTTTTTTIPVTEVVRDCNFNGSVTFNTINDSLNCPTSKKFQDCYNGTIYYTMDVVKTPTNQPLVESMVYETSVNGTNKCLAYMGKTNSVSGNMSIVILSESHGDINSDGCINCNN